MSESMVILFKPAEIPYVGVVTVFWRFYENEWVVVVILIGGGGCWN